jgi:hypothetical protein
VNIETAFKYYWGLRLHFRDEAYSLKKYGIHTKQSEKAYNSLTRNQAFKFDWLARKYSTVTDLVYACIACELEMKILQYTENEEIQSLYYNFKGRRASLGYYIKCDIEKANLANATNSDVFFGYLGGQYTPEYVILRFGDNLDKMQNSPNFAFSSDRIRKLRKYKDFFNVSKYQPLIENGNSTKS